MKKNIAELGLYVFYLKTSFFLKQDAELYPEHILLFQMYQ